MHRNRIFYPPTAFRFMLVFLLAVSFGFGYSNLMAPLKPLLGFYGNHPELTDYTSNPTAIIMSYQNDYALYSVNSYYQNSEIRRIYDPRSENETDLHLDFFRFIDDKSQINGGFRYTNARRFDLFSSLEQDYYGNYFSMVDSTTGNLRYDGPRLWFRYNRKLFGNLVAGLNLEYGVERGLKSRYTECESIIRNNTSGLGLGYKTDGGKLFAGGHFNYHNRQFSYESVGDYYDAQVYSFSGFNVITSEHPRRRVEKIELNNGHEIGFQFWLNDILSSGLGFGLFTTSFGREADVELGSTSRKNPVGYWVREGTNYSGIVNFLPDGLPVSGRVMLEQRDYKDWARAGSSPTIILENEVSEFHLGISGTITSSARTGLYGGFESVNTTIDYQEYILPFEYSNSLRRYTYKLGLAGHSGLLTTVFFEGIIGSRELDFHWAADELKYWGLKIGIEQQYTFGVLGVISDLSVSTSPDEGVAGAIQAAGISMYIRR